jgi:beta-fructofuranosidase
MSWVDRDFFAPESMLDGKGRRIMWAWIFDGRKKKTRRASGWSGTFSLPRVLALGEDNMLRMWPPKELEVLRYNPKQIHNLTIKTGSEVRLKDVRGDSIELLVEMVPDGAKQFGVKVCVAPDSAEQTLIFYDAKEKKLKIDTNKSSLGEGPKSVEAGPFELKAGERLKLRVFVDKSVVEVFANNRQAVTRRIYPTNKDSVNVVLFSKGGSTKVPMLKAWNMMASNPY